MLLLQELLQSGVLLKSARCPQDTRWAVSVQATNHATAASGLNIFILPSGVDTLPADPVLRRKYMIEPEALIISPETQSKRGIYLADPVEVTEGACIAFATTAPDNTVGVYVTAFSAPTAFPL